MTTLTIDDTHIVVPQGTSILQAALQGGLYIPHLCFHPDLPAVDNLPPADRIYQGHRCVDNGSPGVAYDGCQLCVVEIDGQEGLHRACATAVDDGMTVRTVTEAIKAARQDRIMLLLAKHPHVCLTCAQREGCARYPCSMDRVELERCCARFGRCEFQKLVQYVGIKPETPRYVFEGLPHVASDPLFERNYNLCVGCTRCVRVCRDVRGVGALDLVFDGSGRVVVGHVGDSLRESDCRFCTACVEVCPTGTLIDKKPFERIPCSSGCPVGIDVPRYVRLIAEGRFDESYAVVREKLPLPSICSYTCLSFCEQDCRRGDLNEPVGIRSLKRFVSENHDDFWKAKLEKPSATGKRVAVVGSGPAGLTAAYYLARKGHEVVIFEQASAPGGLLRQAVSRKRLPRRALQDDIDEILAAGVRLELNTPQRQLDGLLNDGFDAVFRATGSTFVGIPHAITRPEKDPSPRIAAGGETELVGISEEFISWCTTQRDANFLDRIVTQVSRHRGDSSRSGIWAIASGRRGAQEIDRFLGGDGDISETLLPTEDLKPWIGRREQFAGLGRIPPSFCPPMPQYAGMPQAGPLLSDAEATAEAGRCLRCELRLTLSKPMLPPKRRLWIELSTDNVASVPEVAGTFQLLNENEEVVYIKGAMNLHREIAEQLAVFPGARFFMYEEEEMFSKKESELLQQYITEHGQMPEGNRDLDDLF